MNEEQVERQIQRVQNRLAKQNMEKPQTIFDERPRSENIQPRVNAVNLRVREMPQVAAQAGKAYEKTINRWEWGNVTKQKDKIEEETAHREQREQEEKAYWIQSKAKARENWKRLQLQQDDAQFAVNTRVVVKENIETNFGEAPGVQMHIGVIEKANDDGTFMVQFTARQGQQTAPQKIRRNDLILAPQENEELCVGARVGVSFPEHPEPYMGIVTADNHDGTFSITYDGGTSHDRVSSSSITLFLNEELFAGAKVSVAVGRDGTRQNGTVFAEEEDAGAGGGDQAGQQPGQDGVYNVRLDSGEVRRGVPRAAIRLDHSRNDFAVGDRVGVKFPNQKTLYFGRISQVNPDGTYSVAYDGGTHHPAIPTHMLQPEPVYEELRAGDRVAVKFPTKPDQLYFGYVTALNDNGTYSIEYDG